MREPEGIRREAESDLDDEQVAEYLRRNPDFLIRHPDLVSALVPPARHCGDGVVDMQQFMVERLQRDARVLREARDSLIRTSRANLSSQQRIHKTVLALLAAPSFEHLIEAATVDLAVNLGVDVAALCVEGTENPPARYRRAGMRVLEPGTVDRLLGPGVEIILRPDADPAREVFSGAAGLVRSEALIRLEYSSAAPTGLLALGAREPGTFDPGQGTELLLFLSRALGLSLRAWLHLPA